MNITYISQRTHPALLTGSEKYIHELARYTARKYSVEIIATTPSRSIESKVFSDRIQVKTFKEFPISYFTGPIRYQLRNFNSQRLLDAYSKPLYGFLHSSSWGFFSLSMKNYLQTHDFEVIHCAAIPTGTAWLSWRISRKRGIPFVFTPFLHYELSDFKVPWVKSLLREASSLIAVTNKEKDKLIEFGVNPSNIHVIPLGIDYREYSKENSNSFRKINGLSDDLFVILIPRKSKEKGTYDTLRALLDLSRKYRKLGLILLDKTSKFDEPILNKYIKALTLNKVKVIDLGFVTGQILIDAYQASDVVVEPTRVDSFGIIFLEAWACGKPVIAANSGAIPEVVLDHSNGLLVKFGDWEGIEKAIISLIDDVRLRIKLGENGLQNVIKKYSIENMVQKTEQIYELVRGQ